MLSDISILIVLIGVANNVFRILRVCKIEIRSFISGEKINNIELVYQNDEMPGGGAFAPSAVSTVSW
jgi:hypothetical protein